MPPLAAIGGGRPCAGVLGRRVSRLLPRWCCRRVRAGSWRTSDWVGVTVAHGTRICQRQGRSVVADGPEWNLGADNVRYTCCCTKPWKIRRGQERTNVSDIARYVSKDAAFTAPVRDILLQCG